MTNQSTEISPARLPDLIRLLDLTRGQYDSLEEVVRRKLAAMRNADLVTMRQLMDEELTLAQRLHQREGSRKQLMDVIGKELGLSTSEARALPVSQLAARLSQPVRDELRRAADGLRDAVARVAQVNRVAAVATRELWNHLRWVLDSVRPRGDSPVGYSAGGLSVSVDGTRIFEVMG